MTMLYDQFGREIPPARRPETRDIAVASLRDRWGDYPSHGLTPQRLAAIFKEADLGDVRRQAELFEEMEEKDPHLSSQFQIRKLAVQGLDWEILPTAEDAQAKKVCDFCVEVVEALNDWDDYVLDFLDALPKGYAMQEILWDVSGRQATIRGLRFIHPKRLTWHDSLTPRVLTDEDSLNGIDPPPFKTAFHRYKARSGHDTRAGILRVCAWMYLFKNYDVKDWVGFAEIYGQPLRLGKYDQGASKEDKDALLAAIRSIGSDAAGIISRATEIEFVEARQTGSLNVYESLAAFCDAQMSKAILGQTLTSEASGQDGSGSRALGEVHNDVRQDLVQADCKALARSIRRQILRPLVGFNFGWDVPVPHFRFHYEESEDLQALMGVYKGLKEIGFDMSQEHVSERFQVPVRAKGETPLLSSAPQEPGGLERPFDEEEKRAKIAKDKGSDADVADVIAGQLEDQADIDGLIDQVRAVLANAGSLEDARDSLLDLYASMDAVALGELMQRAFVLADLAGRSDAVEGD